MQEYILHIFRISYTCRKHVSGTFEKCGPFFYLGVAQLEKLFSYLNENMLLVLLKIVCCNCLIFTGFVVIRGNSISLF